MQTRRRFGQNFLEPAWADKVVAAIAPAPDDVFLEIGPGRGILTLRLAPAVSRLFAVEIDRDLIASLVPQLGSNTSIVEGNVLDIDLAAALSSVDASAPLRIAGNLPYNISSPVLFQILRLQKQLVLKDATLMLQREVADRVTAMPNTGEYGVMSVLIQRVADVTRLLALPPGAFRPPPAVKSALIRLDFGRPLVPLLDEQIFERMVRSMFMQRRKTLGNALTPFASDFGVSAAAALRAANIDAGRRPETLEIVEIARLADGFVTAKA